MRHVANGPLAELGAAQSEHVAATKAVLLATGHKQFPRPQTGCSLVEFMRNVLTLELITTSMFCIQTSCNIYIVLHIRMLCVRKRL